MERQANNSDAFLRSRILMSIILETPPQRALIADLKDENAQCIVDYLDKILREQGGILATEEGMLILSLLYKIAQSANVFPRCYEIKGINQEDLELVVAGSWDETFRVKCDGQIIQLKAALESHHSNNNTIHRVAVKEFIMWAHLSHENILPFYGFYFLGEPKRLCLAYPWVNNNVVEYLTLFPESPRMLLISDITKGLSYLHQLMIVHGNLKGSHIRITDDGRALISGFALSSVARNFEGLNDLAGGTVWRTAPELLSNRDGDHRRSTLESDVWSFSCLCYEIFTLKGPFDHHHTYAEIYSAVVERHERPMRPAGYHQVDDHTWDLMMKCWDFNPRIRPSCEDIWRSILYLGIRDIRLPGVIQEGNNFTVWEAMRATQDDSTNYEPIYQTLSRVSGTIC